MTQAPKAKPGTVAPQDQLTVATADALCVRSVASAPQSLGLDDGRLFAV